MSDSWGQRQKCPGMASGWSLANLPLGLVATLNISEAFETIPRGILISKFIFKKISFFWKIKMFSKKITHFCPPAPAKSEN